MTSEKQVLGEVLMDELKALREGISALPTRQEFRELVDKVDKLSDDMDVVKPLAKDHSKQLANHEKRLTLLEQAA